MCNNNRNNNRRNVDSPIVNCQLSIVNFKKGISLMEVLASTFVIGVGLLGVLAVIPFGAYQVSKTNHADYCANMLKNAENEIRVRDLCKMHNWIPKQPPPGISNLPELESINTFRTGLGNCRGSMFFRNATDAMSVNRRYRFSTFLLIDPFFEPGASDICVAYPNIADTPHVAIVGQKSHYNTVYGSSTEHGLDYLDFDLNYLTATHARSNHKERWQELMRGQDDLLYTTHENRRTDFSNSGNRPTSSGQYSWFFMFRPVAINPNTISSGSYLTMPSNIEEKVSVDILGCYNRIPDEARTVFAQYIPPGTSADDYEPTLNGASITFRSYDAESLDISKTKYIFVSWAAGWDGMGLLRYADGTWCKIINAGPIEVESTTVSVVDVPSNATVNYKRTIFVVGDFPAAFPPRTTSSGPVADPIALRGLIVPGVLYHKQITDVPIK